MSRGYIYSLVEGFRGLMRAKFSTAVSVFTIFISLILIGVFLILIFNVQRVVQQIQSRMELEVFIDNSFTLEQIDVLSQQIQSIAGIEKLRFISKDDAAEIFRKQFGQEVFDILEENPLPASFQITLKPEYRSAEKTQVIFDQLIELDGVDEVLYRHDLIVLLERYMHVFLVIVVTIGLLLALSSIILVSNTIKLVILSRKEIIEIMKLVGATRSFIRRPFIVEGAVQGMAGGVLAALFFYGLFRIIRLEIPGLILIDTKLYALFVLLGLFFGLIGSISALRKFLKY